jgi:hypothetical protein
VRNCNTRKGYPAKWLDAEVWNWVRGILSDPSSLEKGMARFKTAQEKEAKPIRDRLEVIDDLLTNYKEKLSRLLDLYLD